MSGTVKIGTCSWNYPSWLGHVYTHKAQRAAGYLREYAQHFRTVEIDSWFYRVPMPGDVADYLSRVDDGFTFSCKAPRSLLLTHFDTRGSAGKTVRPNPDFLSPRLFAHFLDAIHAMLPRMDALMLEFGYLNQKKMPSLSAFLEHLDRFFQQVERKYPLAVEIRNRNYLRPEYFQLLKQHGVAHVFSEKEYMPHIYQVYRQFGHLLADKAVIRLLGGNRAAIEKQTGKVWDRVVSTKQELPAIAEMVRDMTQRGMDTCVYVNNHYEGCAPLTIARLRDLLE